MYYKMKLVSSTWLFEGKNKRKLVKLDTFERHSLIHSLLTCIYKDYRMRDDINEKNIIISRLKMSMMKEDEHVEEMIDKNDYNSFLEYFSNIFEINIFLFNCKKDESLIQKSYIHSYKSPYIMIEKCDKFHPLAIKEKNGLHVMLFENFDDDVIRCLNMYEKSNLSEKYEEKYEESFKVDISHLFKYNVVEYLTSIKSKMIK